MAVVADAVYSAEDALGRRRPPLADGISATPVAVAGPLLRGRDEGGLPALPASLVEARAILALAAAGPRRAALGFDVRRGVVLGGMLEKARYVHFALHHLLHNHPALGGLALSQVNEAGRPASAFLRLDDVEALRLKADVVVLGGCRTALGLEARGEGLAGLSRAFLRAGATAVVGSLWRVEDEAAAELAIHFYRGLLVDGLGPAAALAAAQGALRRQERFAHPHSWAAFILQGDG